MAISVEKDVDLSWSLLGDYVVRNGDLQDTSTSNGKAFVQEIVTRIQSSTGDWKLTPQLAASLDEFEGEPNTESTADSIKASIQYSLTYDKFINPSDYICDIIPVSENTIVIQLNFPRILTNAGLDSKIVLTFAYDLQGKGPFLVR